MEAHVSRQMVHTIVAVHLVTQGQYARVRTQWSYKLEVTHRTQFAVSGLSPLNLVCFLTSSKFYDAPSFN